MEDWRQDTTEFPPGYPTYCIYFPSGMRPDFEAHLLAKLEQFGKSRGENLLVACWDIGHHSYIDLQEKIGFRRTPALIVTDDADPKEGSFMILIDGKMIKDVSQLEGVLPYLVDLVVQREKKEAIKSAVWAGRKKNLESFGENFYKVLKKFNVQFSANGMTIGLD